MVSQAPKSEITPTSEVAKVLETAGPVVCAVHTSTDQVTAPRATATIRPDGTIVSLPMEDMAPRLSREEFRAQMIIPPLEESL